MTGTLVVAHHEPDHDGLKDAAALVLEHVKNANAGKHVIYQPIPGTIGAGQDERLKFFFQDHDWGDPTQQVLPDDVAQDVVAKGSGGMNGMGAATLEAVRTGGLPNSEAKYLIVVGVRYDPAQEDVIREAADAFDEANEASGTPLHYRVYKSPDVADGFIVVLPGDGVDAGVADAIATTGFESHHGEEKAAKIRAKLESAVTNTYALALQVHDELSIR